MKTLSNILTDDILLTEKAIIGKTMTSSFIDKISTPLSVEMASIQKDKYPGENCLGLFSS